MLGIKVKMPVAKEQSPCANASERLIRTTFLGLLLLASAGVSGQSYPTKPVHIVTVGAGSELDFASRLIAQGISGSLGQPVVVDNRPTFVAIETVAKAAPDGYNLLVFTNSLWLRPFIQKVNYDPVRDFSPIVMVGKSPFILVVHPSLPAKNVKDLIALAKSKPAELNYASGATGGVTHLAAELFMSMAVIKMTRVAYTSDTALNADLLSGQVQLTMGNPVVARSFVKSGRLRALAVTSAQPSAVFPGLPTVSASGLPGYESLLSTSMFAPVKTPALIISRLNQETVRAVTSADLKEKFSSVGTETIAGTPEELAAAMKAEMATLGKVIKDAGIKAD